MTDQAPATHDYDPEAPPISDTGRLDDYEPTTLEVTLEAPPGDAKPARLFGIPVGWVGSGVVDFFVPNLLGDTTELTSEGRRVATIIADELDGWRNTRRGGPDLIRVTVYPPAAWSPAGRQAAHADALEAARNLDARPVPAGARKASRSAAELAQHHAGEVRRNVLRQFILAGAIGLTDDDLAVNLGMIPNRVATRRKELGDDGIVRATGGYRKTRTQANAQVHEVTDLGRDVWRILSS